MARRSNNRLRARRYLPTGGVNLTASYRMYNSVMPVVGTPPRGSIPITFQSSSAIQLSRTIKKAAGLSSFLQLWLNIICSPTPICPEAIKENLSCDTTSKALEYRMHILTLITYPSSSSTRLLVDCASTKRCQCQRTPQVVISFLLGREQK